MFSPGLAERWEIPDPLTYVFHLHRALLFTMAARSLPAM